MIRDTLIVLAVVSLIFAGLIGGYQAGKENIERRRESTYQAWVKYTGRTDITRAEWEELDQYQLLRQTK